MNIHRPAIKTVSNYSAHDTKIFIAWCERVSKTVIQVLLHFCAATFC